MLKVAFIVCYDNELYMRECMDYISWLKVPDGVETEVIGIAEAESMAAGYNAAMHDSDAKYKVYLHQDVLILNENFIQDMIRIFETNPEYGMLGMVGSDKVLEDADYWLKWNVGGVYIDDSITSGMIMNANPDELCEVLMADGMLLVTQYDVEWREDILDGFEFYDVSQSIEFKKNGYKVGIPHQKKPWCYHMCGHVKIEEYDAYRKVFCEEYGEYGYHYSLNAEIEEAIIKNKKIEKELPLIREALETGQLERMAELLNETIQLFPYNTQLCNLYVIGEIIEIERFSDFQNSFYVNGRTADELLEKYSLYKFLLKRLEHSKPIGDLCPVLEMIAERNPIELEAEKVIAKHSVEGVEKVIWRLKWELQKRCYNPFRVQFDEKIFVIPNEEDYTMIRGLCEGIQNTIHKLRRLEAGIDCNQYRQIIETMFETMEDISREAHVGYINENLYMAYFNVLEGHDNISIFLNLCQEWLDGVLQYVNREERQPLVSVLLSVYNGEKFIEDTLKSVMNQSYENLQIVVVDDCSSDNSRIVIDRLAQSDKRIEILYLTENSNVCKASNLAYKLARGKYIALIGHDDIWKMDKIEKQVHFMEMYPKYATCFTLVDIIDDEKEICNDRLPELYSIFNQGNRSQKEWIEQLLFKGNVFCAPSVLIRRQCITGKYIYHFGIVQLQDMALWLELLADYPVYIMQERLTLYRKFLRCGTNLSAINDITRNRLCHENKYIVVNYIKNLSDEQFKLYLSDRFRDKSAEEMAELKCERAFIVQNMGDFHCIEMFFELFDKEETRIVLEEKYHFKLKDFYELNAKTFFFDNEAYYQLLNAHETIHRYEMIVEQQNTVIEKQKSLLEKTD